MKTIPVFFLSLLLNVTIRGQEKVLIKGMTITRSVKIKKAIYKLDAPSGSNQSSNIIVEGDNIIIDFNNAELKGSNKKLNPDEFFGIGLIVRNSKNVTLKNLKAKGYKVALLATNVEKLTLENCDFSYNYRRHLNSTQEKEDISDWMSYHQNEKDEWLRYGAAMYLRSCSAVTITSCKVTGGQNALMMMECNDGLIYNNDFSFNSGIGIGMYRSSGNKVMYNRVIFNVRGYSHGVYNRGQDSAGILVYEQSSGNLFYKNNVTHGGDGFFLWAGQTTMDTGKGGCNDNMIIGNDFSYAPTNGIEVTFSRNIIKDNRVFECDHGIWGGYSFESTISDNKFRDNRIAIAIEHGQNNTITHNLFSKDKEAIKLWARKEQPANWGYAKYRDTKSHDYTIISNSFNSNPIVLNLNRTEGLNVFSNTIAGSDTVYKTDSTVVGLDTAINYDLVKKVEEGEKDISIPAVSKPNDPFKGSGRLAGRKNILVNEWGPYDFRSPIIWNTNPTDSTDILKFDLVGPKGKWRLKSFKGVKDISAMNGTFPSSITATKIQGDKTDILIQLEYIGDRITTPLGQMIPAGKPYQFSFSKFFQPVNFQVRWFALDTTVHNPITSGELFPPNVRMQPIKKEQVKKLDYAWWGGLKAEDHYKQFITVAEGEAVLEKGEYELGLTWDDAVRLYVDGKLLIDEWNPALYKFDESPHRKIKLLLGGRHTFLVEHLELGGFATLSLGLKKINNP
ncbi:right-handed parallel beta-helix repeat-containing protein [Terrimonas pollutisoli]|uniref:right-handed parallel beta-helix repeat-containing protein n=1 Tax=Terrimonas pollutisoli TaxID=3034147 RepID=UPI0023EDE575|nr:right-handed parallel beta-helix repeat-containing protein [Terrimonas sp. H1YJ31]